MKSRHLLSLTLLLVLCLSLSAQGLEIVHHRTDTGNADMIRTDFSVLNVNAEPVMGLTKDDFQVKLNDALISRIGLSTFQQEARGSDILLCLDVSGSMTGTPLQVMKNALRRYVRDLRNTDRMAIMTFADDVKLICDFIGDQQQLLNFIDALATEGSFTVQYRAVMDAITKMTENESDRIDNLILIGDGIDTDPQKDYDFQSVIAHAKAKGISVHTVGFYTREESYRKILENIARETGGLYSPADDEQALDACLAKTRKHFLNTYVLTAYPDSKLRKGNNSLHISVSRPYPLGVADTLVQFDSETGIEDTEGVRKDRVIYILIAAVGVLVLIVVFSMISKSKKKKRQQEMIRRQKEAENDIKITPAPSPPKPEQGVDPYDETRIGGDNQSVQEAKPYEEPQRSKPDLDRTVILSGGPDKSVTMGKPSLILKFVIGPHTGKTATVTTSGATIGRATDNTVVIPDQTVSSRHASITYNSGSFFIEDAGSKNGIYIDGRKIKIFRIEKNCSFKFGSSEGHIILN